MVVILVTSCSRVRLGTVWVASCIVLHTVVVVSNGGSSACMKCFGDSDANPAAVRKPMDTL